MNKENIIYKIKFQNGVMSGTVTTHPCSRSKAGEVAEKEVPINSQRYVIEEVCTSEEWERGVINYCPRCGDKIEYEDRTNDMALDCYNCSSSIDCHVEIWTDL